MGTNGVTPIFAPDAQPGDYPRAIPNEMASDAIKAGGMPAVRFQTPEKNEDGSFKVRFVRADQTADAIKNGGKLLPFEQQDVKHPGFWSTLYDEAAGLGKSLLTAGPTSSSGPSESDVAYEDQLKAEGHGKLYRLWKSLTPEAMRESAETGDIGGTAAHGIGEIAPLVVGLKAQPDITPGVSEFSSKLADAMSKATPKQVAQVIGGAGGAGIAHGGLSPVGAYYGAKGAGSMVESVLGERANEPIIKPKTVAAPPEVEGSLIKSRVTENQPQPTPLDNLRNVPPEPAQTDFTPQRPSIERLSDYPPKVVIQAVDELGPNATQQEIAEKAAEIKNAPNDFVERIKQQEAQKAVTRGASPPAPEKPEGMSPNEIALWQEGAHGEKPPADIGTEVRNKNPEPTSAETGRGGVPKKVAASKAEVSALRTKGYSDFQINKMRPEDVEAALSTKSPAEVSQMKPGDVAAAPPVRTPIPNSPQIRAQQPPATPEDLAETENIRDKVKNAAEAEDRARLREVYGQNREGSDVSTPKTVLTGTAGEGNDVYLMHPRGETAAPDFTKLTKEIETPQQAARQLENLKTAGASDNAINDFEMRASRRFGEDWKHQAAQHDNLEGIVRESLKPENLAKFRAKAPKRPQP